MKAHVRHINAKVLKYIDIKIKDNSTDVTWG
jgi:hypothetical protein